MGNYRILLGPINDGAAIHEDGGTISLAAAEAAPLMELGAIEPLPAKEAKPRKPAA
jgi:hypothetical protein